jgi:hypothetical protein
VETIGDISPIARANDASSKGFCIRPRLKEPRSPPTRDEEQSDRVFAISANREQKYVGSVIFRSSDSISASSARASSSDNVMTDFLFFAGYSQKKTTSEDENVQSVMKKLQM